MKKKSKKGQGMKQQFNPQKFETAKNKVFNLKPRTSLQKEKVKVAYNKPKKPRKLKNVKQKKNAAE